MVGASGDAGRMGAGQAVAALARGTALALTDRTLRGKVLVALLVNAVAFLVLLAGIYFGVQALTDFGGDGWLAELVRAVVRVVVYVVVLLWTPVLFVTLAGIFLPMFQTPVFRAARAAAGAPPLTGELGAGASVALEVRRLVRFVGLSALLLLVNLLPGVGTALYMVLQLGLTAHELAWDLMAPHLEGHGLGYHEQRRWLSSNTLGTLALGAAATLLLMVPVAQLLFITTNYAGAGLLSAQLDQPKG